LALVDKVTDEANDDDSDNEEHQADDEGEDDEGNGKAWLLTLAGGASQQANQHHKSSQHKHANSISGLVESRNSTPLVWLGDNAHLDSSESSSDDSKQHYGGRDNSDNLSRTSLDGI